MCLPVFVRFFFSRFSTFSFLFSLPSIFPFYYIFPIHLLFVSSVPPFHLLNFSFFFLLFLFIFFQNISPVLFHNFYVFLLLRISFFQSSIHVSIHLPFCPSIHLYNYLSCRASITQSAYSSIDHCSCPSIDLLIFLFIHSSHLLRPVTFVLYDYDSVLIYMSKIIITRYLSCLCLFVLTNIHLYIFVCSFYPSLTCLSFDKLCVTWII